MATLLDSIMPIIGILLQGIGLIIMAISILMCLAGLVAWFLPGMYRKGRKISADEMKYDFADEGE